MSRLTKRVWANNKSPLLTEYTKIQVYRACVQSTLLYGSESLALRARQERKLNANHVCCLRHILELTWQDKVTNNSVLGRARITSIYTMLKQRRMRWLGQVMRMGRIHKDLPKYGELMQGKRPIGIKLRYKDECKRDLKAMDVDLATWETLAADRSAWRQYVQKGLFEFEESLAKQSEAMRQRRKANSQEDIPESDFV
ncbi:uncharacterized protein [Procambarus clarkii]|uniref:uncharacterized protein n=1 Tax=Procambarus clarkii TaxID=6728 RepID=UPI003742CAEA